MGSTTAGVLAEASADDVNGPEQADDAAPMEQEAAMTRAVDRIAKNIEDSIAQATEKAVTKITKSKGFGLPAQPKEPVFKNAGHLCMTILKAKKFSDQKAYNMLHAYEEEVKVKVPVGANETNTAQGGYFLKPTYYSQIWDHMRNYPKLIDMCDRQEITGNTFYINEVNETGLADGQRHAGVRGYWLSAEAAALTTSYPATAQASGVLCTNVVYVAATNLLLEDANIESFDKKITELAMDELLWQENDAITVGAGSAGVPPGILNQPALATVTKSSLDSGAKIFNHDDLTNMWQALYPSSRSNAVWLVNPEALSNLERLSFVNPSGTNSTTSAFGGLTYDVSGEFRYRLKGRPVVEVLNLPQYGALGDIMLVDLKQLVVPEHKKIFVDYSPHVGFGTLETYFRFYRRYTLASGWKAVVLSKDGNYSYSPFVTLQARGT